jgi:hypothetical protein
MNSPGMNVLSKMRNYSPLLLLLTDLLSWTRVSLVPSCSASLLIFPSEDSRNRMHIEAALSTDKRNPLNLPNGLYSQDDAFSTVVS